MIFEVKLPDIGVIEAEVTEILVKIGDKININQSLITIEGDKTLIEIPSPTTGIVKEICINVGDKVKTNELIIILNVKNDFLSLNNEEKLKETNIINNKNDAKLLQEKTINIISENLNNVYATPIIRRLAREHNIDLKHIKGTGRKGRIIKEDIQKYLQNLNNVKKENNIISNTTSLHEIDFSKFGNIEEINFKNNKRNACTNLQRNWNTIPLVTQFDKVDVTELELFRKKYNNEIKESKTNIKITLLIFIIKAVSKALEKMPYFNSSLSFDNKKLYLKKYINIGIAIDTNNGLLVPVLHDVNKKNITDLSIELTKLLKKSNTGKLTLTDTQGSCFTISNLGNIGGSIFTPIVNAPEVAILGISKTRIEPIWDGYRFIPKLMLPLSLSYDHRVIDGADGARFINLLNSIILDMRILIM